MPRLIRDDAKVTCTFEIPFELRERARAVARILGTTISAMIRESLGDKVDYLESKIRYDKERRLSEKMAVKTGTLPIEPLKATTAKVRNQERDSSMLLAPSPSSSSSEIKEIPKVYHDQAARIFDAIKVGSTSETRLRIAEAIMAVKKQFPVSHPSDTEIISILEGLVIKMREAFVAKEKSGTSDAFTVMAPSSSIASSAPSPPPPPPSPPLNQRENLIPTLVSMAKTVADSISNSNHKETTVRQEDEPPPNPFDIVIDTSKIKSHGDV